MLAEKGERFQSGGANSTFIQTTETENGVSQDVSLFIFHFQFICFVHEFHFEWLRNGSHKTTTVASTAPTVMMKRDNKWRFQNKISFSNKFHVADDRISINKQPG